MSHFTYSSSLDRNNLSQGDILDWTDDLEKVLLRIHPYFASKRDQYSYFQIISQSCDLVRRGKECKAEHITIVAVRDLETVLDRELKKQGSTKIEKKFGLFNSKHKPKFQEFLKRLVNNNNPKYFYLHNDPEFGIYNNYVSTLRVSVALKSNLHYDTLLAAKKIELTSEFKAKLGWLVGNLYSRVGTQDWSPDNLTKPDFDKLVKEIIESNFGFVDNPNEYASLYVEKFASGNILDLNQEEFLEFIQKNKLPKKRNIFETKVSEVLEEEGITGKVKRKILAKILQEKAISQMIK
jgi:hypothetical protein